MEAPIDKGDEAPVAGRAVRMKRSPGGRHRVVKVLLTEEEHAGLGGRAVASGVSLQRYLIEAGMSGSVSDGATTAAGNTTITPSRALWSPQLPFSPSGDCKPILTLSRLRGGRGGGSRIVRQRFSIAWRACPPAASSV